MKCSGEPPSPQEKHLHIFLAAFVVSPRFTQADKVAHDIYDIRTLYNPLYGTLVYHLT